MSPRDVRNLSVVDIAIRLATLPAVDPRVLRALARDPRQGVRGLATRLRARQDRMQREAVRLAAMFDVEREQRARGFAVIAGVDEVGVAPLAGPVVAAAVILPGEVDLPELDDSKCLTPSQRETLHDRILAVAVAARVGMASVEEIDRFNILQATRLAHQRAILGLTVRPQLVLIDGRYAADVPVPQLVIIDGDAICASVAAASIIAKVTRDRLMTEMGRDYPQYGFAVHKGYSTRRHIDAIRRYGITPAHRRSFFTVRTWQETLLSSATRVLLTDGSGE